MSRSLPVRPSLEQLKKQAKSLVKQRRAGGGEFTLAEAQREIAREYGFASWSKLKSHVETEPNRGALVEKLRAAAGRGDLAELKTLLDADPTLINETGGSGVRTALHQTVFGNQEAAARFLLERGADPNIRCEGDNAMPLHFACEKKQFPIIKLLIEHGADPIGADDYHELEVIGWACAWDYIEADPKIVDYLLAHGSRHNIWSAVAMGDVKAIRRLVKRNPELLERRMELASKRRRPVHLAVIKKQGAALKALLDLGANVESLDEAAFTVLDVAAMRGEAAMADLLLERGARVRMPAAVGLGRSADLTRILRRDPDISRPGNRWGTLIVRAAERGRADVIEALIAAGASVNVHDNPKTAVDSSSGYTPLHAAAFKGQLDAARVLLKHGAEVAVRESKWHGTPAGWAAFAGHKDVHDLIVQGPVDIMEAVENGFTKRVFEILEKDPEALNRPFHAYPLYPLYAEGWFTPLVFAVVSGHLDTAKALLDAGADASVRGPDGQIPQQMVQFLNSKKR